MKSILLELIPVEPELDEMLEKLKKAYQITGDATIINRLKRDSISGTANGTEYKIFENHGFLITGKIDDFEPSSMWIEVFKKQRIPRSKSLFPHLPIHPTPNPQWV